METVDTPEQKEMKAQWKKIQDGYEDEKARLKEKEEVSHALYKDASKDQRMNHADVQKETKKMLKKKTDPVKYKQPGAMSTETPINSATDDGLAKLKKEADALVSSSQHEQNQAAHVMEMASDMKQKYDAAGEGEGSKEKMSSTEGQIESDIESDLDANAPTLSHEDKKA